MGPESLFIKTVKFFLFTKLNFLESCHLEFRYLIHSKISGIEVNTEKHSTPKKLSPTTNRVPQNEKDTVWSGMERLYSPHRPGDSWPGLVLLKAEGRFGIVDLTY